MTKSKVWLPTIFALLFILGYFVGSFISSNPTLLTFQPLGTHDELLHQSTNKIEEIVQFIDAKYIEDVENGHLIELAIDGVINELDPHSKYIPSVHLQSVNDQLDGNYDGIGVEFMVIKDTITVVAALSGGPSELAGILPGDKIVSIDDTILISQNATVDEAIAMLKGKKGSTIKIGIQRNMDTSLKQFEIERAEIPVTSVDAAYMLTDDIGYIKISKFSSSTYEEFMKSIESLMAKRAEEPMSVVLDLRDNPGGYMNQATNILSQFFEEKGITLVQTNGRASKKIEYKSSGNIFFSIKKIAVLINEGSASASEIIAGVLQDMDRGVIIGRKSFGKGLVQEQYNLSDGSALRLTVAQYYLPSGRSIQRNYADQTIYNEEMMHRYENGEMSDKANITIEDSTAYYTRNNRVVFSESGIIPDVFIPIDTFLLNEEFISIRSSIPEFAFTSSKSHADGDSLLMAFAKYMNEEHDDFLLQESNRRVLSNLIRARIAKFTQDNNAFYEILNKEDQVVKKAVSLLSSDSEYENILNFKS